MDWRREREGSPAAGLGDPVQDAFEIAHHITISEAENPVPGTVHEPVAVPVISDLNRMGIAIDLDDKPGFLADEVGDVGAERNLSFELETEQPTRP